MGKFDGMLLVSDFDNTLLYTEAALRQQGETPTFCWRDLDGISRWISQGGTFAVATGRAMMAFRPYAAIVPMNAPSIVDNGGAIYDFEREEFIVTTFLSPGAREHIAAVTAAFPCVALELYHPAPRERLQVFNPTPWNDQHAKLTGIGYEVITAITPDVVPEPISKALFVADRPILEAIVDMARQQGWSRNYELVFSSDHLLEMTAKGANKGDMVKRLQRETGCDTLLCIGDHLNDLPMLRAADRAFCPANAEEEVRLSGAQSVCHCLQGAVGEVIELLERGE